MLRENSGRRDTEFLSELRKKRNVNTGRWRRGTQRARNPRRISEIGGEAEK